MKKTISVYWPVAILGPLAALAYLYSSGNAAAHAPQARLDAEQLTAELAHAVSYGMIDAAAALPAKPIRAATALPLAQAS